jgi:hypothetical protein
MATGNKLGNFSACVFRKVMLIPLNLDLYDLEIADRMVGMVLPKMDTAILKRNIVSTPRS